MITNKHEFQEFVNADYKSRGITPKESTPFESKVKRSFKRRNPIVGDLADLLPWKLYDRATAAAAAAMATELQFFTVPQSAVKTKNDTNLDQAQRLPDPRHFFIRSMRFIPAPFMYALDLVALLDHYYCELWIGGKVYMEGPLHLFPGGTGLTQGPWMPTSAIVGNWSAVSLGLQSPREVDDYGDRGFSILQGQPFKVKVIGTTFNLAAAGAASAQGGTGLNLLCVLDGLISREVQ